MADLRRSSRFGSNLRLMLKMRPLVGNRAWARTIVDHYRRPTSFPWYRDLRASLNGKKGIEIGGPSAIFGAQGAVPVYPCLASWDNVDYASHTLWSLPGRMEEGRVFNGSMAGRQFLADGTRLTSIDAGSYEVVLSSHVLEHLANPLRALGEWRRILRPRGLIVAVVPEGARTFDHRREPTPISHLLDDLHQDVQEDELGHLPEVLGSHDLSMDPGAEDWASFVARSRRNAEFRALHHHVFTLPTMASLLETAGFTVRGVTRVSPFHLLAWGEKSVG
jgi:SAM-dependent methyltransferase